MNGLITICGRGGSKGLKNKNILRFLDFPLILYSISAADLFRKDYEIKTGLKPDICVNSDSLEILKIAENTGICSIIQRPEDLARDTISKIPVIRHSLMTMETRLHRTYDFVLDLDITSPIRKISDICRAVDALGSEKHYDVIFSVVPSRRNPYFNMVKLKDGNISRVIESDFIRRQETPVIYDMNASIYCYRRNSLFDIISVSVFEGVAGIVITEDTGVLDIDSLHDYELMQWIGQYYYDRDTEFRNIRDNVASLKVTGI